MAEQDDIEEVETYRVILAMTRPPTVLGIPYSFFLAECFVSLMAFLALGSILWFPVVFTVLHAILYVACTKIDLWLFDIIARKSACGVNPVGRRLGGGLTTYGK
ncbi:VirB3 family type IV secretion system protein [Aminobacter sp. MET-1]|uniref:VirB3 family type IV secretion system protein n=1 Tax=Aminobacter sp. MET-1 TaxID=2951085 RepID=UPI002269DF9D|nr:VirB3 family type IV secretion system protein [Aminobacter sp. MET-1]MCX8571128.1 VirB3 family type IV secretion system protein [Aminobacter sp. MET-1]MCX8573203.1 VirB3 family type IV secretion system protein [Aminobacter sp. MET-1]